MAGVDIAIVVLGVVAFATLIYDEWDYERQTRMRHAQIDNELMAQRMCDMSQEPGARSEEP